MHVLTLLSLIVSTLAYEITIDTYFNEDCVSAHCSSELSACEADTDSLTSPGSKHRSHCRTLMYCISQVQGIDDSVFPSTSQKDVSLCLSGLTLSEMSSASLTMKSCLERHNCMRDKPHSTGKALVQTSNSVVDVLSFDAACMSKSCPAELGNCGQNPVCKSMVECLELKQGEDASSTVCTSSFTSVDKSQASLISCGRSKNCLNSSSSPSSFFEEVVDEKSEAPEWKKLQTETEAQLVSTRTFLESKNKALRASLEKEEDQRKQFKKEHDASRKRLIESENHLKEVLGNLPAQEKAFPRSLFEVSQDQLSKDLEKELQSDVALARSKFERVGKSSSVTEAGGVALPGFETSLAELNEKSPEVAELEEKLNKVKQAMISHHPGTGESSFLVEEQPKFGSTRNNQRISRISNALRKEKKRLVRTK